jgi:glyoxylase-like metal-dependent hydrolase (beta-lactamase superfamily II)
MTRQIVAMLTVARMEPSRVLVTRSGPATRPCYPPAVRPLHVVGLLHRLRGLVVSNVLVLDGGPGDCFVVDTGPRLERPALLAGLRALGFAPREPTGVRLTHHRSDHAGNAAYRQAFSGVPVLARAADAEVREHRFIRVRIPWRDPESS